MNQLQDLCHQRKHLNYFDEIPENEDSIEGNAAYKANFIHSKFNTNVFADDTGLEVESLNGRPGIHSARFAGIECDAEKNIDKLLFELKKVENRKARFKTVIALIINNKFYQFEGIINGEILKYKKGNNGFGYDPIFKPLGYNTSMANLPDQKKDEISHRGIACNKLKEGMF